MRARAERAATSGWQFMAVTLPYQFDTTGVVKQILQGVFGLLVVVVVPDSIRCSSRTV